MQTHVNANTLDNRLLLNRQNSVPILGSGNSCKIGYYYIPTSFISPNISI